MDYDKNPLLTHLQGRFQTANSLCGALGKLEGFRAVKCGICDHVGVQIHEPSVMTQSLFMMNCVPSVRRKPGCLGKTLVS